MSTCGINPYCTCDPCGCEEPCSCGLVQVGLTTDQQWDAGTQELTHTVTRRFRPAPTAGHTHGPASAHADEAPFGPPAEILDAAADHASLGENALARRPTANHAHGSPASHASVRSTVHRGHTIEIHTTYQVSVDGVPLDAHMGVGDDGNVHYHGLPNYTAASAIDVIREVVDSFPDDYPVTGTPAADANPPAEGGR